MVPWRGGDSQRALSCIDKLRTELNWPQRLKPPYFWACHRTAEAVRLTTPASGAGRGPRSKAFALSVRNGCATRNGRMELSTIRRVSGRAKRDVVLKGTASAVPKQRPESAALAAEVRSSLSTISVSNPLPSSAMKNLVARDIALSG